MTLLRLTPLNGTALAGVLLSVDEAVLIRRSSDVFLDLAADAAILAVRALARSGIVADPVDVQILPPPGLVIGVALDLSPVGSEFASFDMVRLERVALGASTRELLRRRLGGLMPSDRVARDRCRALLRGDCARFRWGRRVWARREMFRAREMRSVRPVVFDRGSLDRWRLDGRTCARDAALSRWAFH